MATSGSSVPEVGQRLPPVRGLADELEVRALLDLLHETAQEQRVIVGQVDADPRARRHVSVPRHAPGALAEPGHAAAGSSTRRGSSVSRAITSRWICEVPS